jgi:hypothetical protein
MGDKDIINKMGDLKNIKGMKNTKYNDKITEAGQFIICIRDNIWRYGYIEHFYDNYFTVRTTEKGFNGLVVTGQPINDKNIQKNVDLNFVVKPIYKNGKTLVIPKNIFGERNLVKFIKKQ